MKETFELVDMILYAKASIDKAIAVDNEILDNYFSMPDGAATPEVLKYYYSQYRTLHDVLVDYLFEAQNNIGEASKAIDELWQAEAGRKPGEPVKQR